MDGFTLKTLGTVGFLAASSLTQAWASESGDYYRRALGVHRMERSWQCWLGKQTELRAAKVTTVILHPIGGWDSLGKNTGVGTYFRLQRISQPRYQTGVSCIAGGFFTS